jgi:soluble lytic murein transglycosylase-like protein
VALVLSGAEARAELVVLASGRTLSVLSHRVEGDRMVLALRGGGEVVCEASLVARIDPDEVPRDGDEAAAPPEVRAGGGAVEAVDALIQPLARHHGVDPGLVHAVVAVESAYRPGARSARGAMGLMQLMPAVATQYGVADPYEPWANLDAGIRHLKALLGRYDLRTALAAYNAGEGAVQRYRGIPPFPETRAYVARILQHLDALRRSHAVPPRGGAVAGRGWRPGA